MSRTTVNGQQNVVVDKLAEAYQTLDDGFSCQIPRHHEDGRTIMAATSGVTSNVNDLLDFYRSVLDGGPTKFSGKHAVGVAALKQLLTILIIKQCLPATVRNHTGSDGVGLNGQLKWETFR